MASLWIRMQSELDAIIGIDVARMSHDQTHLVCVFQSASTYLQNVSGYVTIGKFDSFHAQTEKVIRE